MSVENPDFEEEFSSIVDHIFSAEPELLNSVTADESKLILDADPHGDWSLFKIAVRVAVDDVTGDNNENISFDEEDMRAVVRLS